MRLAYCDRDDRDSTAALPGTGRNSFSDVGEDLASE
jgi:hypothetical protein